ncbi:MAG: hypothetical protein ACE365_02695 [Gammaproteobacteria bacterium]
MVFCPNITQAELVDPTRPSTYHDVYTEDAEHRGLQVSYVLVSPSRRIAYVNDQFVKEGDTISGFIVQNILQDGVNFTDGDANFFVPIVTKQIRQPMNRGNSSK